MVSTSRISRENRRPRSAISSGIPNRATPPSAWCRGRKCCHCRDRNGAEGIRNYRIRKRRSGCLRHRLLHVSLKLDSLGDLVRRPRHVVAECLRNVRSQVILTYSVSGKEDGDCWPPQRSCLVWLCVTSVKSCARVQPHLRPTWREALLESAHASPRCYRSSAK